MAKATITARHLFHARTHKKDCGCNKSEVRDSKCEKEWPDLCPWWAMQMHRHNTGDYSNPEWWRAQLNMP